MYVKMRYCNLLNYPRLWQDDARKGRGTPHDRSLHQGRGIRVCPEVPWRRAKNGELQ